MPLYQLTQVGEVDLNENASLVIRAKNETEARWIANKYHRDEGQIWEDETKVIIDKVKEEGVSQIILIAYREG